MLLLVRFVLTLGACYILNCNSFTYYRYNQPIQYSIKLHKSHIHSYTKSFKKANLKMALGFDCDVYPKLADFLYGTTKLEHCNNDILFSKSGNEFDLFGDLSLIICLVALNYVSSRSLVSSTDVIDKDSIGLEENNINKSNNIIDKSDLICPQCKGEGAFMKNACELCDGTGLIEYNYEQNTKSLPSINNNTLWDDDEI